MKIFVSVFLVIIFYLLSNCHCQNENFGLDFSGLLNCWHIKGLGISLVNKGKIVSQQGFGVSDQNGTKVDVNTGFHVGSLTKAFTSTITVMAAKEHNFSIESPIDKDYQLEFDAFGIVSEAGTLVDIMAHRLGIENSDLIWLSNNTDLKDGADLNLRITRMSVAYTSFRSDFYFNNIMYWALGLILKVKSNRDWCSLAKDYIFNPLQMNDSFCKHNESNLYPIHVASHFIWDNKTSKFQILDKILLSRWDYVSPGEGLVSTVNDMTYWLQANLKTSAGNLSMLYASLEETKKLKMTVDDVNKFMKVKIGIEFITYGYGLGWFVANYRGLTVHYHQGSVLGHKSLIWLVPEKEVGIFLSVTGGDSDTIQNLFLLMYYLTDWVIFNGTKNDWFVNLNDLCDWTTNNAITNYFYPTIIPTHFDQLYTCNCYEEPNIQLKECEQRQNLDINLTENLTISDEYLNKLFSNTFGVYGNLLITKCDSKLACNYKSDYCIQFGDVSGRLLSTNLESIFYICPEGQLEEIQKTQFVRQLLIKLQENNAINGHKYTSVCGLTFDQKFPPLFTLADSNIFPFPIVFILLGIFIFGNVFSSRRDIKDLVIKYYSKAKTHFYGKIEYLNKQEPEGIVYTNYLDNSTKVNFEKKTFQEISHADEV